MSSIWLKLIDWLNPTRVVLPPLLPEATDLPARIIGAMHRRGAQIEPNANVLWVSDFTYVATWAGFVYVAFVIDAYARRIVGWRGHPPAHAGLVLHALGQALHDRKPVCGGGLVHHSDRGVQYVSIKYTERLAEA